MLATKWSSLLLKKTTIYELKISQSMNDSLLSSAPHSYIYILRTFYRDLSHWCRVIKLRNPKIDHENTQRFLRISHSQDPSKLHLRSQDNALEWLTAKYVGKWQRWYPYSAIWAPRLSICFIQRAAGKRVELFSHCPDCIEYRGVHMQV